LDFVILNKFEPLITCLMKYVDQHLNVMSCLPKFKELSVSTMCSLLNNDERQSYERLFDAFALWIKEKDKDIDDKIKQDMINVFDLKKFSRIFLLKSVRRTNFFPVKEIYDVLEVKVNEIEAEYEKASKNVVLMDNDINMLQSDLHQMEMKSKEDINAKKAKIKTLQNKLNELTMKWKNADINLRPSAEVVGRSPRLNKLLFSQLPPLQHHLGASPGIVYKFKTPENLNKIQFSVLDTMNMNISEHECSYTIEGSMDGKKWSTFVNFTGSKCKGLQTVFFEKQQLEYLCIRLKAENNLGKFGEWHIKIDESDLVLMLDTVSGERKNLGQSCL